MDEKAILEKLKPFFKDVDDELEVRLYTDNIEKRSSPYTLSLAFLKIDNVNEGLPDYNCTLQILLDCFKEDDPDGDKLYELKTKINSIIERMTDRFTPINVRMEGIEGLVASFYDGCSLGNSQTSYQCQYTLSLIFSF